MDQIVSPDSFREVVNGLYWVLVIFSAPSLLLMILWRQQAGTGVSELPMLPFLAVFYALVALNFQAVAYLYFALIPVFLAILWWSAEQRGQSIRRAVPAGLVLLSAVALYFHAAQWVGRPIDQVVRGVRIPVEASNYEELEGIQLPTAERRVYERLLDIIRRFSGADDTILAIPSNADLYYLTGRRNPLRHVFVPFGIRDERTRTDALSVLKQNPPKLIFHVPHLPYNTAHTESLLDELLSSDYLLLGVVREFEVYLHAQ